ncbi:MAG: C2 family cysteine protease [Bacteroidota bacterium]
MKKHLNPRKRKDVNVQTDKAEHIAPVASQQAPAFSLTPVAQTKRVNQKKGDHKADGKTIQKEDKTNYVSVPEKLGKSQEGPIAVKGKGDDHEFSPNDVRQGSLGDCYFLSSLIAVAAQNPNILKNNINENSDGTYTIKLHKKNVKKGIFWDTVSFSPWIVTLYPTFPISVDSTDSANPDAKKNPPHAHGGDTNKAGKTELWVRLYEKAFALMIGSYNEVGKGQIAASHVLEVLLGKQFKRVGMGKKWTVKRKILRMWKKGIPVKAGTGGLVVKNLPDDLKKFARDNSIVGGHAYGVVYADKNKIRVRNPWGEVKDGLGAKNPEPEMTWDQFTKLFTNYTVNV